MMVRLITKEYQHSQPETREVPCAHAYAIGSKGSFALVTIEDIKTGALIEEWRAMDIDY